MYIIIYTYIHNYIYMYRICLVMLSICIVIVCCVFHFNTRMILCIYCITTIVLMFFNDSDYY